MDCGEVDVVVFKDCTASERRCSFDLPYLLRRHVLAARRSTADGTLASRQAILCGRY